jgi:hypothetical protein
MKTSLWAVVLLAIEALLVWGYFSLVEWEQPVMRTPVLALLVGTVSVLVWLGFDSDFGQTLKRLLLAVIGCIVLTYAALVVAVLVDLPTGLVCERGRTEVEATPHIQGGRFEAYRVGPCVFYNPESRPVPGLRGGSASGD